MSETLFTDIINNLGKSKVKVTGSGSKTGKQQIVGAPEGITSDKETINLQDATRNLPQTARKLQEATRKL